MTFRKGHPNPAKGTKRSPEVRAIIQAAATARRKTLEERYWAKVDKRGADECWPWLGAKNVDGYGQIYPGPVDGKRGPTISAHHVATKLAGIDVPDGMVRDHICKNRGCQNPAHIRIVTQFFNCTLNSDSPHGVNSRRTHCSRCGRPFAGENLAIPPGTSHGKKVPTRACLHCYPQHWLYAAIKRDPPPGRKVKTTWRGPFQAEAK